MFIRFSSYAIGVFCTSLWIANCFAASPANDVDVAAPIETTAAVLPPEAKPADLLTVARQANEEVYRDLESFVCDEQIQRFKGRLSGESSRRIDTVLARVSFENGVEHYDDIRQNNRERPSMSSIAGAWSTGEFGTLLRQTEDLMRTQPALFRMYTEVDGTSAAVYGIEISAENSPWDLEIVSRHYRIPFRTEIWVSRASGQILKIERVSTSIPFHMGISEIRWGVTLQPVDLNGRMWLLPKNGNYAVQYEESGRSEWNDMSFANYHRYGSEVALRFQ